MRVDGERKEVGVASVPFAETVEEAVEMDGEAMLLHKRNSQSLTNAMNKIRAVAKGGTSKKYLRDAAMKNITVEEWQKVAGDGDAIEKLLEEKILEIEAEAPQPVSV